MKFSKGDAVVWQHNGGCKLGGTTATRQHPVPQIVATKAPKPASALAQRVCGDQPFAGPAGQGTGVNATQEARCLLCGEKASGINAIGAGNAY